VVNVTVTTAGTSGPRGNAILNGVGVPAAGTGFDGDYYFDTTGYPASVVLYGPKAAGAWPGTGVTLANGTGLAVGGDLNGTLPNPTVKSTHLTAALPVAQGGTGSATQNFVDLTTDQTAGGNKTLSGYTTIQGGQVNQGFRFFGTVGFFGDINVGRQTVTGAKGGNAALASLITALATLGLITDNTTA
jgi:hypothetical protein